MAAATQRYREFRMPDVGEGLTEAEILKWLVQPGDPVTDGQVVVEVETAKAAVELPIPYDGRVGEILFPEGTTVEVGTPIITVDTGEGPAEPAPGEPAASAEPTEPAAPAEPAESAAEGGAAREPVLVGYGVAASSGRRRPRKAAAPAEPTEPAAAPATAQVPAPAEPAPARANGTAAPGRSGVLAKPPVRKLAKDLGVELASVVPTGPGGVITRDDVHAAVAPRKPAPAPAVEAGEPGEAGPTATAPEVEPQSLAAIRERRVPVRGVRKATAQAMVDSAFTAPHVTEFVTVDVTRTVRLVEKLKSDPDLAGLRVNPLLLVARALLVALRRNPEANAAWDEERQEIVYKDYVNLGIAAATPRGLLVPNIKDAGAKTLPELSRALGELINTAREGRTSPAEMRGGTVTITNIGVFGIDTGTPILNPGESAILAFGAIKDQPWVHKGKVKPRKVTTLALSFDHRLIDGELGSRLLADIATILEHPKKLITWT
ncbi:dihydrolipoamide acetyltransferase family protein [Streptomyces sp. DSM 44915]|uniref:Dihydrolipoamide acetyltransferase component of pyruvate dehydrogenase complex n=1 Tax=Streptomyces chisholmiae TaxID=3075540 RepID=A0ABU2JPY7_9ACTN|nr:dihydrolipoamide acetyltransferase family protein [Streptomyces sp. DSM 44915]MDT0267035.1 dihydrolipoamide acetyltransferase family protein [Streptomyces sp. DSM 44915]